MFFRRRDEGLPPSVAREDHIARFELHHAGFNDFSDGAAFERLPDLKRRHIRFPLVHPAAHVGVDGHEQIPHQHLLSLHRRQSGFRQGKIGGGGNTRGSRGEADFSAGGGLGCCPHLMLTLRQVRLFSMGPYPTGRSADEGAGRWRRCRRPGTDRGSADGPPACFDARELPPKDRSDFLARGWPTAGAADVCSKWATRAKFCMHGLDPLPRACFVAGHQ